MRRVPRWAWFAAGAVALYAALGFLLVPFIARRQLESRLPPLLHRPASVREVRFNPFAMSVTVRGFSVRDRDGAANFVSFDELYVNVAFLRLLTGHLVFEEISLQQPAVDVALLQGGKLSFADLIEGPSEPKSEKPGKQPTAVRIEKLRIDGGSVAVADLSRGAPVRLRLAPLTLHLDNFTTEPQQDSPYSFNARMDPSTVLRWQGDLSVNPLRSSGTIAIEDVSLATFAPYAAEQTKLVLAGGALTVRGKYRFDATQTPLLFTLDDGSVAVSGLRLDGPAGRGPLVELSKLLLSGIRFDLAKSDAAVGEIALEGGTVRVRREQDGSLELATLTARPPAPKDEKPSPFHTALKLLRVAGLRVEVDDRVPPGGARFELAPIELSVGPLEWPTEAAIPLSLSVGINQSGLFTVKGAARANGAAEVDLGLQRIALAWGQPYVAQSSNAQLRSGLFTLSGHASAAPGKRTSFNGALSIDGLSVFAPGAPRELLGVERFALDGVAVQLPPVDLRIGRVLLRGLRTHVVKNADGALNIDALSKGGKKEAPPAPAAAPPSRDRYAIGAFVMEGSSLEYGDRSVTPPFDVKVTQLAGKAAPLAWPNPAQTKFDFSAKVDAAPWQFAGTVAPKGPRAMDIDAAMTMKGWDLLPTSGYALKATGYPVEKGKFSADLKYKIREKKIDGENVVVIDQLSLGDHKDVEGATSLPVKLALAILTDRNGVLTVDLPVSGDLDDPSFSFGRMIWATVKNLLVKVATSPFALLGSLAGGNDDLSTVSFAPGSSDLEAAEIAKLQKLAKALIERPALKLEVVGKVDPAADGEALRRMRVQERAATPELLRAEWSKAHPEAKPPLPDAAQMLSELVAREPLGPDELEELASERSDEAQQRLLETEGLAPERVFVIAPKVEPAKPSAIMTLK